MIRLYIYAAYVIQKHIGIHIRGIGRVTKLLRKPCEVLVDGVKIFVDPSLASSYYFMLAGKFNEPETHLFVNALLQKRKEITALIDAGMNIGEMVLDFARHAYVSQVYGFEPNVRCVEAVQKSIVLNGFKNIHLYSLALGRAVGTQSFHFDDSAVNSSAVFAREGERTEVSASTIDHEFNEQSMPAILIIDVEGAELDVVVGAQEFVRRNHPLIIFEYHYQTRTVFTLDDMKSVLGSEYDIYRLRHDGLLDRNLEETWNCVAVHRHSAWSMECQSMIIHD